ncbi:hypothetical protein [Trichormus variabilis]|uniref:hypothetical protein n=1 Tax=Anabaena variabilis TaxID=264691 RepID=UPI0000460ABA
MNFSRRILQSSFKIFDQAFTAFHPSITSFNDPSGFNCVRPVDRIAIAPLEELKTRGEIDILKSNHLCWLLYYRNH